MRLRIRIVVIGMAVAACWAQTTPNGGQGVIVPTIQTAAIAGTVVDGGKNTPLGGAVVTAYRKNPAIPVYRSQATTGADGSFSLMSLPAGTYNLCVQALSGAYLDPCAWDGTPVSVTVADGQKAAGNTIKLKSGAVLVVRVDDPGQHLQQKPTDPGPGHVLMALLPGNGPPIPLAMTKNDTTGTEHQLIIPMDTKFKLVAFSKEVALQDPDQKAVAAGGGARDVSIPSTGPQPAPVTFKVTGRNP